MRPRDLLLVVSGLRRNVAGNVSLTRMADRAGWSRFHLQRSFRRALGETPRQFAQRLRLERAAARLVSRDTTVAQIARECGFASHEVFTRAFRRHFGCSPMHYRRRTFAGLPAPMRGRHAELVEAAGPCIRLHHFPVDNSERTAPMATLSITREQREPQPILLIRRRVSRSELQGMLAECFGKLFAHGSQAGLPIAGWPLARYVAMGPGLWTVEAAMPLAAPTKGEGEMEVGSLPGGPVALGVHAGPYDQLGETHSAIERWMEANGYRAAGAPWEWYVTDPAEHPDPADWRTEVYWPLAE